MGNLPVSQNANRKHVNASDNLGGMAHRREEGRREGGREEGGSGGGVADACCLPRPNAEKQHVTNRVSAAGPEARGPAPWVTLSLQVPKGEG